VELGSVDVVESVVLVCAPPLLLTVTPEPTCVAEEVAPDVFVVSAGVVPVGVGVDPLADVDSPPEVVAVDAAEVAGLDVAPDPVDDSPVDVELDEPVDEPEDAPAESAPATPGEVTTITPIPNAAANAPNRPMYRPSFAVPWAARVEVATLAGTLDEEELDTGLTRGLVAVMGRLRCRRDKCL
jgi:hypothetical protein